MSAEQNEAAYVELLGGARSRQARDPVERFIDGVLDKVDGTEEGLLFGWAFGFDPAAAIPVFHGFLSLKAISHASGSRCELRFGD